MKLKEWLRFKALQGQAFADPEGFGDHMAMSGGYSQVDGAVQDHTRIYYMEMLAHAYEGEVEKTDQATPMKEGVDEKKGETPVKKRRVE